MRVADVEESRGLFRTLVPLVPTKDIGRREYGTLFWRPPFCVEPDMTATVEPLGGPNAITAGVRPDTTVAAVATTARGGRRRAVVVFIVVVSLCCFEQNKIAWQPADENSLVRNFCSLCRLTWTRSTELSARLDAYISRMNKTTRRF